jgi:hypothetical protein
MPPVLRHDDVPPFPFTAHSFATRLCVTLAPAVGWTGSPATD